WIDEDLIQGDTSDDAAVEGASNQQLLRELEAKPDLLAPKEADGLVRVLLQKAIRHDDMAEAAAKFCTRVIRVSL
ncbi:hypothetical protein MRX96_052900, partial [Rhipicephalus microplus]